ncbi:hypothetical protein ACJX0J_013922, partial [Zea mays]
VNTPFEARGLLSGTIIRGTLKAPNSQLRTSARTRQLRQLSLRQAPALLRRPRHHTNRAPKPLQPPRWLSTYDHSVFSFYPENRPCRGFEEVLVRYRQIVPHLNLSGPTSFAPLIYAAISVVENSNWQYHVLVIIADGQVTAANINDGRLSPQEQATIQAIVDASYYPLSIVMVGVGDGPWDAMQHFEDCIPERSFDNFQFVNFTGIMSTSKDMSKKEVAFALAALMEIPSQYKATQGLRPPEKQAQRIGSPRILPPPNKVLENDNAAVAASHPPQTASSKSTGIGKSAADEQVLWASYSSLHFSRVMAHSSIKLYLCHLQVCPICLTNPKDMAFQCGHLK